MKIRPVKILAGNHGSAMAFVLVVTVLMLSGALWAVATYRAGVNATTGLIEKFQARVEAESVLQLLLFYGATGEISSSAMVHDLPREYRCPPRLPLDGTRTALLPADNTQTTVAMQDLAGSLNVVFAPKDQFNRLLQLLDVPPGESVVIADSLQDWLDSDDFHQVNGAERWYYEQKAGVRYRPRNSIFIQSPFELALIRGMKDEYLEKILPHITVAPTPGYNPATMTSAVLAVTLGCTLAEAEQLVALRGRKGYFTANDILQVLGHTGGIAIDGLGVPSRVVRITVESIVGEARQVIESEVTFAEDDYGPFRHLTWNEGS